MLTLPLLLVPVVWCIVIWWKWKKSVFDVIEKIPGLKWYPFFGTFLIFRGVSREDILDKFAEVVVKYGPFYRSWHGTTVPEVHLTKPHHMQIILRSSTHTEKGSLYKLLYPFLGDGSSAKIHRNCYVEILETLYKRSNIQYSSPRTTLQQTLVKEFGAKVIVHKKKLRQIVKTQIENTQSADDRIKLNKQSFLDLILDGSEDQKAISDQDLQYLVNTFVAAGFETTANTALWALFLLGNHPEVQEKLFEEVREVLKDKDAPSKLSDLDEMKYMECVIKETLRLYPPLPFVSRRVAEDININCYTVPADTQALIHIFFMHRDPEYWPEPNKFDPERFTVENSKDRHPFSYIPFSAGHRNCIGQRFSMFEEKVLLSSIVKKYRIVSKETPEQKRMFGHVILRPQNGIDVKLQKR